MVGVAAAMVLIIGLLLADRGREPVVLVGSSWAPMDSFVGAVAVAQGLVATWVGLATIAIPVAWVAGSLREVEADSTLRGLGFDGRRLLNTTLVVALATAVVAVLGVAMVIAAAGSPLAPGDAAPSASALELSWMAVATTLVPIPLWWSLGVVTGWVSRSAVAGVSMLGALIFSSLAASNLTAGYRWLPTSWLGAIAGFQRGGSSLTDVWANGSELGLRGLPSSRPAGLLLACVLLP